MILDSRIFFFALISFVFFKAHKAPAQTFSFNLQTSSLVFDYSNPSDFNTPRTIPKAFTIDVVNSRSGRYNIYCKLVSNSGQNLTSVPVNLFSVKLNSANFTMGGSYFLPITLGLTDVLIGNVTNRNRRTDTIYYDLILNPLSLNINPDNYSFSFIFTVSE
ncbi:hypothetical protein EGI22_04910 [Lacihabitans sp. LS3-19]|nr:hypothetical protein [Lacihabitans sp. LS3-19]